MTCFYSIFSCGLSLERIDGFATYGILCVKYCLIPAFHPLKEFLFVIISKGVFFPKKCKEKQHLENLSCAEKRLTLLKERNISEKQDEGTSVNNTIALTSFERQCQ